MSKIDIAIFQSNVFWENPEQNYSNILKVFDTAKQVDIIVLPEMFNTGFTNNVKRFGESLDGESVSFLKQLAKDKDAAVCASLIIGEDQKFYNSFLFVNPNGEIERYNKRHLFKMGGEADMFTQGQERVVVGYKGNKFLLQICYDLRFPVWSRNRNDYDAIIYIANWPGNRRYIYDTLLRARAIENQSYVIAANRIGEDGNGIKYNGGSCVIDSKGNFIANANDNAEEIIYASLDFAEQKRGKQNFPAWSDADSFDFK